MNVEFEGNFEVPCRFLLGGGLVTRDSAASNKELMKKAYDMGKELVKGF